MARLGHRLLASTVLGVDLTTCPAVGCGFPAEVLDRPVLESTDGPVEHVRLRCPIGHWHLMPAEMLELLRVERGVPPMPPSSPL